MIIYILLGDKSATTKPTITDNLLKQVIRISVSQSEEEVGVRTLARVIDRVKKDDLHKKIFNNQSEDALEYVQKRDASKEIIDIIEEKYS